MKTLPGSSWEELSLAPDAVLVPALSPLYPCDWGFPQSLGLGCCCCGISEGAGVEVLKELLLQLQSRKLQAWKLFSSLKMNKPGTLNQEKQTSRAL